MSAVMTHPARIETANGRRWWKCARCRKTIGEIVGDRVVIKVGDRVVIAPIGDVEQTCSCGVRCVID